MGDTKYEALFELAPNPIFLAELSSKSILEVNDRAVDLLGYDRATLEGMDMMQLHPTSRTQQYRSLFEETVESGAIHVEQLPDGKVIYLVSRDGEKIPVELHAKTITVDGEPVLYTVARDITQQQELQRQRDRFEEFAKVVSHDLRNPLHAASSRLELATEDFESEHLAAVERALDRMDALIENLLRLARSGDGIEELEAVDLSVVPRQWWENVESDSAELEVSQAPTICADRARLQQLFENLFRNAVDHSEGPVTLTIGKIDEGFYFEDDGPGMPPTGRDDVFDMGYSTTDGGTGFGLYIVKKIVDAHGWNIRVTEGEDGGARFEITDVEYR